MAEKVKKLSKKAIALIVAGCIIGALLLTVLGFYIGYWMTDASYKVWTPSYEMLAADELKAVYEKPELTEEDYGILFGQTGLTKVGVDRARNMPDGLNRVLQIQKSYFEPRGIRHSSSIPLLCTEYMDGPPSVAGYFEVGDIVITSSTHFSGFKVGHAAIITDKSGRLFQSNTIGASSSYSNFNTMFAPRVNFMILRIKPEYFSDAKTEDEQYRENLARATEYIETEFKDVHYDPCTGVFTKKDSTTATTCSHMLWYGFKHFDDGNGGKFNLDLDYNGRLLVLPKDISLSPYVELVQTFGFDPAVMYD